VQNLRFPGLLCNLQRDLRGNKAAGAAKAGIFPPVGAARIGDAGQREMEQAAEKAVFGKKDAAL
jgi:hypothetical protein